VELICEMTSKIWNNDTNDMSSTKFTALPKYFSISMACTLTVSSRTTNQRMYGMRGLDGGWIHCIGRV